MRKDSLLWTYKKFLKRKMSRYDPEKRKYAWEYDLEKIGAMVDLKEQQRRLQETQKWKAELEEYEKSTHQVQEKESEFDE